MLHSRPAGTTQGCPTLVGRRGQTCLMRFPGIFLGLKPRQLPSKPCIGTDALLRNHTAPQGANTHVILPGKRPKLFAEVPALSCTEVPFCALVLYCVAQKSETVLEASLLSNTLVPWGWRWPNRLRDEPWDDTLPPALKKKRQLALAPLEFAPPLQVSLWRLAPRRGEPRD